MASTSVNPRHFLITGPPGCGKTTLLVRLALQLADLRPGGFYTEEIREGGMRQGFRLTGLDGRQGVLAHVRFKGGRGWVATGSMWRGSRPFWKGWS